MAVKIQLRRDSSTDWTSNNPTLALGEPGVETDTLKLKVGDGATAWNSLDYSTSLNFNDLNNKPTTIAGYGITDAFDANFNSLTGTPTTLAGYGITDASTTTEMNTAISTAVSNLVDSAPGTLDTLNELAASLGNDADFATNITNLIGTKWTQDNLKISNWDTAFGWGDHSTEGYLTSVAFGDLTSTPTTLAGYGITDAATSAQGALADTAIQPGDYNTLAGYGITDAATSAQGALADTALQPADIANSNNWDAAYAWGNHAVAGYLTSPSSLNDVLSSGNSSATGIDVGNSTIGALTITGTTLDTTDSSPLTITPGVTFDTEITVSDVVPSLNTAIDLGSSSLRYREVHSQTINAVDPNQAGFSGDGRVRTNRLYFGDENYTSYFFAPSTGYIGFYGNLDPGNIFHNGSTYTRWKSTGQLVNNFGAAELTGGTVDVDFLVSDTVYFYQPSGALTVNFTNIPDGSSRMFNMRIYIAQAATAYIPTAVQVNGVAQTIEWQNGVVPTGTAGNIDFVQFLVWSFGSGSYVVLGQSNSYA